MSGCSLLSATLNQPSKWGLHPGYFTIFGGLCYDLVLQVIACLMYMYMRTRVCVLVYAYAAISKLAYEVSQLVCQNFKIFYYQLVTCKLSIKQITHFFDDSLPLDDEMELRGCGF